MLRLLPRKWFDGLRRSVPAEWETWLEVARAMGGFRSPSRDERRLNALWAVIVFALGAIPAALSSAAIAQFSEGALAAVFGGVLAFSGLLVGFLVTLMLFTGRLGSTQALDVESLRHYGSRLRYLLASQAVTLVYALLVAVLCLLYLLIYFSGMPVLVHSVVLAMVGGSLSQCVVRATLLPVQIFELHDAHLDDELNAKIEESNRRYDGRG